MQPVSFKEYREKLIAISNIYEKYKDEGWNINQFMEKCRESGITDEDINSGVLSELLSKNEEVCSTGGVAQVTAPIGMEKRKNPLDF